jgi:uncharacterized protein (UPF0332 family)
VSISEHLQKARAFLQDAQLCSGHERYDSAASRAYYAMFRAALALMEQYGYLRPAWNHGRLKGALVRSMVEERAILTRREVEGMEAAYALRLEADYGSRLVSAQEVQEILDAAHHFLAKVEGVIPHET